MNESPGLLIVNFGGPRDLEEVESFLIELLTDPDLIRTKLPSFFHRRLFRRIAKKRVGKLQGEYKKIGGKSPIYETTEALSRKLQEGKKLSVVTFHRYLPSTHLETFQKIEALGSDQIIVLPLFPQFSYATTGSIARMFQTRLTPVTQQKLCWIKSYAAHPAFLRAWEHVIRKFIADHNLCEKEIILLFSAHGIPQSYVAQGDPYEKECEQSFFALAKRFPQAICKLAYQSKFGPGEWLRPYTKEVCEQIINWCENRKTVVVIPLAFTCDHIETLFEIEEEYMPIIKEYGLLALRCPALNLDTTWIEALEAITDETSFCTNQMLIRVKKGSA